ncbi:MAG: ATP-binding protein [Myxococcota bacterium]
MLLAVVAGLTLAGAPPVHGRPLINVLGPEHNLLRLTYGLTSDRRGVLYAGRDGGLVTYDGHQADTVDLPALGVVWAVKVEGDRLYYAGSGGVGFVDVTERVLRSAERLTVEGLPSPVANAVLPRPESVEFGTVRGQLIRCARPLRTTQPCSMIEVPGAQGFSQFVLAEGRVWGQVKGIGWLRFEEPGPDGTRPFEVMDEASAFREDRMFAHAPGRRPGEHLLGFLRRGLFWWTEEEGLRPVAGWDVDGVLIRVILRLATGCYAVGTHNSGLFILDGEGKIEHWTAPNELPANNINSLHELEPGLLWMDAGFGSAVVLTNPSVREFDIGPVEVKGVVSDGTHLHVLTETALFRLEGPSLVPVADVPGARSLHRQGELWWVGTIRGIEEIRRGERRVVWPAEAIVEDLATSPDHPGELFAGVPNALVRLRRRADGTFEEVERFAAAGTVRDISFAGAEELWFRAGRNRPRRLIGANGSWTLESPGGLEVVDEPGYTYLLSDSSDRLWMTWGNKGLRRWDRGAESFVEDRRLASTLGVSYPQPILHYRMNNPEALVGELLDGEVLRRFWVGRREADQAPHQATWFEVPTWWLGRMQTFHIQRAAGHGQFLVGGVGLHGFGEEELPPLDPPRPPLIRRFQTRTSSGTAARSLALEGEILDWSEHAVELRFASPEHHAGSRMEYRSRWLGSGAKADWSPWDTSTVRVFDFLPSGPIRLELQARDEAHRASLVRALDLEVRPPPWASPLAIAAYVVGAVILLSLIVAFSTRTLRQRAKRLAQELVKQRTAEALSRGQARLLRNALSSLAERPRLETLLQETLTSLKEEFQAESVLLWLENAGGQLEPDLSLPDDIGWPEAPLGWRDLRQPELIEGRLWIPLVFDERGVGLLAVVQPQVDARTPPTVELARALGAQATLAIRLGMLATHDRQRAIMKEREAISRDVHDSLAQGFVGTGLRIEQALREAGDGGPAPGWQTRLRSALELNRLGLREARRFIEVLRFEGAEDTKLAELIETVGLRARALDVQFSLEVQGTPWGIEPRASFELYRIAQEAINNALKHARAGSVRVVLRYLDPSQIEVEVIDDGQGFDPGAVPRKGLGLRSMKERAHLIGATLRFEPGEPSGTRVHVTWTRGPPFP